MPVSYFLPIELWNYRPEVSRGHFACQHEELPRRTASIDLIASFLAVWEEREGNHLFTNCDIWASAGCHELVKAQSSQLLQRTVHWMALALWYKIQKSIVKLTWFRADSKSSNWGRGNMSRACFKHECLCFPLQISCNPKLVPGHFSTVSFCCCWSFGLMSSVANFSSLEK